MRACVKWLDRALRQYLGIIEYCEQPQCVLRIAPARAAGPVLLPDGTAIARGDPLLELHLWNERLHADGFASLARGCGLRARLHSSLDALAEYLADAQETVDVRACHALFRFQLGERRAAFVRVVRQLGFTVQPDPPSSLTRMAAEHSYVLALQWTYNPAVLHQESRRFERLHLWMSRRSLLARYGRRSRRERVDALIRPTAATMAQVPSSTTKGMNAIR
jgi:hypothetical protein